MGFYGNPHNEIEYQGITAVKVGDITMNLTNQQLELTTEDKTITLTNKSIENDMVIDIGLTGSNDYVKKSAIQVYTKDNDVINGTLKIGNDKYLVADLSDITLSIQSLETEVDTANITLNNKYDDDTDFSIGYDETTKLIDNLSKLKENVDKAYTSSTQFTKGENGSKDNLQNIINDIYKEINDLKSRITNSGK